MPRRRFTQELWGAGRHIYASIIAHPFIRGLTDGTLGEERFRFYVVQDALYLSEFARALNVAAAHAPDDESLLVFSDHAKGVILVERSLHDQFFRHWGLKEEEVHSRPMAPTNLAYTSFLVATAYSKPFHELLGALLPCYWIYWEVGKELERRGSKKELYQRWIGTYSSKEYAEVCRTALDIGDSLGRKIPPQDKTRVRNYFITSCRYEYMFWDAAYRMESWPI